MKQPKTPTHAPAVERLELYSVHDVRVMAHRISGLLKEGVYTDCSINDMNLQRQHIVKALAMVKEGFFPFFKPEDMRMLSAMLQELDANIALQTPAVEAIQGQIRGTLWGGGGL